MAERQAGRSTERGEGDVLDEQLAGQARSAGADREPDAHLPAPGKGPREHDARDVGAGHDEEDGDGAEERPRLGAKVAGEILAQRAGVWRHRVILVARIPNGLVRAQEVLLAVLHPDARLQPADRVCEVALILLGRIRGHGHPQPDVAGKPDGRGHHSHDRVSHAV